MTYSGNAKITLIVFPLLMAVLFLAVLSNGRHTARAEATAANFATLTLNLQPYATGFDFPVALASDGHGRLFVVQQGGTVRIIEPGGTVLPEPFLTIPPDQLTVGGEQGLLGLVFHPDYATNGYFYVNYTDENEDSHISRFSRSDDDPDLADYDSELIMLDLFQPYGNHNAGDLHFGPDGYLYVPLGDGGDSNDPENRAQDPAELLGKMLRIDVDSGPGSGPDCGGSGYTIPADNPLLDGPGGNCDEIWAIGLRNPWRFSFDRLTGDMYIGDVGQGFVEEINFQPAGSPGGQNYGWRCYEGSEPGEEYDAEECAADYTFPVFEYRHYDGAGFLGCAVTGGYVYRGQQFPTLAGTYVLADFCSGNFWTLQPDAPGWPATFLGQLGGGSPSSFGEDDNGELYVVDYNGTIYQVQVSQFQIYLPAIINP